MASIGRGEAALPNVSALGIVGAATVAAAKPDLPGREYSLPRWCFDPQRGRTSMRQLMRDDALLARLQGGEEGALAEVAETYGSKIYQLAFRYLRNKEDAEEVVQDVLYKVHRKVGSFRGDAALSSWIYRITFNTAMSRLRTAKYQRSQVDEAQLIKLEGDESMSAARLEVADWSDMADER